MEITLESLHLVNFQSAKDLKITFGHKNFVYGQNEAGKSRLFNAFSWLLFDKDSLNRKDFAIKTLDTNNEPVHFLDHSVEGTLIVDGLPITLKKVYSEKWTKKRGSATDEFSGHTTDYFIDGVPVKLAEYKARITQIINEETFKLLTDANYFNGVLKWKDRRRILIEVAGDVTDADVIASNKALAGLPAILGARSIDDHRKVLASKQKEINDHLKTLPVRIDEATRSIPRTVGNEQEIEAQVNALRAVIQGKEAELSRLKNGGEVAEQQKRMREIEGELLEIKNRLNEVTSQAIVEQNKVVIRASMKVQEIERSIRNIDGINTLPISIQEYEKRIVALREKWNLVDAEEFPETHEADTCAACGQALPAEQVQAAHDKASAEFNRKKSEELEKISAQGKETRNQITLMQTQLEDDKLRYKNLSAELEKLQTAEQQERNKLDTLQAGMIDVASDPSYTAKQVELDAVKQKIITLQHSSKAETDRVELDVLDLRNELKVIEQQYATFEQVRKANIRIEELKADEKKLSAEFERLQHEVYLTEQFIVAKVNMLETRINSKFKHARFKLFETQINGGISEMCETLYEGVPYSKGLNHGNQILIGLDIIDTLQAHYGIHAPCWVDNAEAVTQEVRVDSQLIALYASAGEPELSVESVYRVPNQQQPQHNMEEAFI